MKKTYLIAILFILLIASCTRKEIEQPTPREPDISVEATGDITASISEAGDVDSQLAVDEIDSDMENLEQELNNW